MLRPLWGRQASARNEWVTVTGEERAPALPLTTAAVVRDYGDRAALRPPADLEATTIRMRAPGGLDILAYLASGRTVTTAEQLDVALERGAWESVQPAWLCGYGRARALLAPPSEQGRPGLAALRVVSELDAASLLRRHALTYAWALARAGDRATLAKLVTTPTLHAEDVAAISTELARAAAVEAPSRDADLLWRQSLGRFLPPGAAPFRVPRAGQARFDDIESIPTGSTAGGPLVTVVTPVYRPSRALVTSVASILAQSWQDLELIVVDDGSGGVGEAYLDEVEQSDERVRVIRLTRNEGTYRARNVALALARGEFVTGQDADDWSHPKRIEYQVRPLLQESDLAATVSRSLRLREDLAILFRGYPVTRVNASSLMFRRTAVQTRIGLFDSVRKSADSEFQGRIEAVFGRSAIGVVDQVLAFVRLVDSSLSRGDFSPGWHHERRVYYRTMFERWHERIRCGSASPFVGPDPRPRPFPAPRSLDYRPRSRAGLDVVLLGDWRKFGGPQRSMLEEIRALKAAGHSVAIAHKEAMRFMVSRQQPLCEPILRLIAKGEVEWIQWDDEVEVGHVILRYPPILQFADPQPTAWRVRRLWLVANQAPLELDHTDQRYVPSTCHDRAAMWFGLEPTWVPQGPQVRRALEPYVHSDRLAPFDSPGIIDDKQWRCSRPPLRGRVPVVGRHSRDETIKFPASPAELLEVYDLGFAQVRMLGAAKAVPRILGDRRAPQNWQLLPHGAQEPREFLGGLDFFVYYHDRRMVEAFGRAILEGVASGCLVVLDPRFSSTFGDAAVYAEPSEVRDVIAGLASDQAAYDRQIRRSAAWLEAHFSHASFVRLTEAASLGSKS